MPPKYIFVSRQPLLENKQASVLTWSLPVELIGIEFL